VTRKTFRACVLTVSLLLQTAAFAQAPANAKDPAQDKSGEVKKPEADKKTEGEPAAKLKQTEGEKKCAGPAVLLQAVLHSSGEVRNIEFLKFTPEDFPEKERDDLIKKSVEAAGRVKFQPPQKGGRLVSQRVKLEYCFDPDEKNKE
jgi:hypothetical protein